MNKKNNSKVSSNGHKVASKAKAKSKSSSKSKRAGASRVTWAENVDSAKTGTGSAKNRRTGSKSVSKKDSASEVKKRSVKGGTSKSGSSKSNATGTKSGSKFTFAGQSVSAKDSSRNGSDSGEKSPKVLSIDIGGTKVKMLVTGELEPRKAPSGTEFTPMKLLEVVNELTPDWEYDVITIGFPGLVGPNGPLAEPGNLGPGWVGFDFAGAFQCPVKILNDAAMQAVGSYEGGRMLFVGLGTGFGSTVIVDHVILAVELSGLRWNSRRSLGDLLSKRTIKKIGLEKWRSAVHDVVHSLMRAFVADYVVVGGGNAKLLKQLPAGARVGHNQTAFRGGFRVWGVDNNSSEDLELHGNWKIL